MIWLCCIAKCSLAILQQPIAKHTLAILATSYCLNRNNRVSSFYLTRGSKQCFSHVSLILVATFLFLRAFLGCTGIRFLVPFLVPLALRASTSYMRPLPVLCGKQRSYPTVIPPPPLPVKGTQPIAPTLRPDRRGGGVGLAHRVVTVA